MNKRVKWGIIIVIGAGLIGGGIYSQLPKENEELAAADKVMTGQRSGKKILNVNAKIIKPQLLKDEIQISGSLLPDEEVDLSFETSGKIIEINFEEGSFVKKGQLLAKVNDRPLQAQLQRLVSQLKLAEDRVFRQNALLERDAVSKEAYEQVKTELATLNADIDLIESNIAQTELRAPFDGSLLSPFPLKRMADPWLLSPGSDPREPVPALRCPLPPQTHRSGRAYVPPGSPLPGSLRFPPPEENEVPPPEAALPSGFLLLLFPYWGIHLNKEEPLP